MRKLIVPFVCLLIGAMIYVFFRKGIVFLSWVGLEGRHVDVSGSAFCEWIVYSLPDGLWYMSLLWVEMTFTQHSNTLSVIVFYLAVTFPFVLEFLQHTHIVPGTFDWFDVATYCLTLIIFVLCKRTDLHLLPHN